MAFLAETCIFLELGLSVFGLHKSYYFAFCSWAFAAALLGRALSIYPISCLYNFSLTRPVPVSMLCTAMDETTSCVAADAGKNVVDSPLSDYRLASKDGILMETVSATNNSKDGPDDTGNATNANANDQIDSLGGTDVKDAGNRQQSDDSKDSNPSHATLPMTSSYLMDLPGRRETPLRKRDKVIPLKFMHILWFAGLRGAVAYAVRVHYGEELLACLLGHDGRSFARCHATFLLTTMQYLVPFDALFTVRQRVSRCQREQECVYRGHHVYRLGMLQCFSDWKIGDKSCVFLWGSYIPSPCRFRLRLSLWAEPRNH